MKARNRRILWAGGGLLSLGLATMLVLSAFEDNLVFFFTPSEVHAGEVPLERTFRIGGMVEEGSVRRDQDSIDIFFRVTDMAQAMEVKYSGILPDLFREGQGVVAEGKLGHDGLFVASRVLARHDETYMPVEAAEALKRAQDNAAAAQPAASVSY